MTDFEYALQKGLSSERKPRFDVSIRKQVANSTLGLSIAEIKKEYKKNCKTIITNREKITNLNTLDQELYRLLLKNWLLISAIAKCEPFIFLK
jgi:hypothetical protein